MKERAFHNRRKPFSLAIHVIAGAVGLMAGLQYLFSTKSRTRRPEKVAFTDRRRMDSPRTVDKRTDYFSIRRTKSEVGFIYWVLQGHGAFQCFALFDTWKDALEEALRRASNPDLNAAAQWVSAATV